MKSFLIIFAFLFPLTFYSQTWNAPTETKNISNPVAYSPEVYKQGQKIYNNLCKSCHGIDGKGDPVMVKTLNPPPADFTRESFQKQSDGEIFWKLSEGKGVMAAYKNMLSEKERWAVIHYIRNFKNTTENTETLQATTEKETIESFPFTGLINNQTTHIIRPKGFGLVIQHRFGATKFNEEFITNFMGLDLAANIRFGFQIPINEKLYTEIGRTRYGKFYDWGTKYKIASQTEKFPVSIALYENIALTTEKTPQYPDGTTFVNGEIFQYKFAHRLRYDTQLLVSRKFNNWFSGQIGAQFVWINLFPVGDKPYVWAVPLSLRFKTGLRSAIDVEFTPNSHKHTMPMSLAYEVASSGNHIFQITITNTDRILPQNILTTESLKHKDGFMLGFNLIRYF